MNTEDMAHDGQIIHHLWWLRRFLHNHFGDKEYKDIVYQELDSDTLRELTSLLTHIKEKYEDL